MWSVTLSPVAGCELQLVRRNRLQSSLWRTGGEAEEEEAVWTGLDSTGETYRPVRYEGDIRDVLGYASALRSQACEWNHWQVFDGCCAECASETDTISQRSHAAQWARHTPTYASQLPIIALYRGMLKEPYSPD